MKTILLLASSWLIFSGFAIKNEQAFTGINTTKQATVQYAGDPSTDGFGWVLMLADKEVVLPDYLPDSYCHDGLTVFVEFVFTGEYFPTRSTKPVPIVEIIHIEAATD